MDQPPPTTPEADTEDAATHAEVTASESPAIKRASKTFSREPTPDETVKETIESIVIAFILAFVFRAFIVEPFIIPTGSMAPTMLGAHLQMQCPSCGYGFTMGIDAEQVAEGQSLGKPLTGDCPMCYYEVPADSGTRVRSGDRILVDKFSYHLGDPRRWDVVVFKAPKGRLIGGEPAPRTNFIKRLIGLPGERICLLDGNVFVAPAGTDDFRIARKTDPETNPHWERIQRAIWQPIYYSQYVPIEDATQGGPGRSDASAWRVPWKIEQGEWDLGSARRPSRVYRFAGGEGEIRFEMTGAQGTVNYNDQDARFPYNQQSGSTPDRSPIEDIRIGCAFRAMDGEAIFRLATNARLDRPDQGVETLAAEFDTQGRVGLFAIDSEGQRRALGDQVEVARFKQGVAVTCELWLVDDEASLWVNGERVLVYRFDLTWHEIGQRPKQAALPRPAIGVTSEGPVELRRVELDRDIYYFPDRYSSPPYFARAEARRVDGAVAIGPEPLDLREQTDLHDEELFVLGDNQPASEDGRAWNDVDGWVVDRHFGGEVREGVVPRSLLVGRAFMVYYPAPQGSSPSAKGIFPDFGRMRFVH